MQSYWMQMTDTDSVIECRQAPMPEPKGGQLLVKVHAASLNRGEFVAGHGLHGKPGSWKAIGGECAGEVVATGDGVSRFKAGERVMGRCNGAFAEYALLDEDEAMVVPEGVSWEEAASIPLTYLVSYDMIVLQGKLQPGEWVLINGVSSGVGVASLQLAKALGGKVIGTSGSAAKLAQLEPLGLDLGICTRKADFADAVMGATGGHGVDLVVNTVGGTVFAESVKTMAFEGRLATVGYVDGVVNAQVDLAALHAKRLRLFGVSNKLRTKAQKAAAVPTFAQQILPLFANGQIKPQIDRVFAFEELAQAKAHMEAGGHVGKIVLAVIKGH